MGVPSFYRWLVGKYPKIVANAVEGKGERIDPNVPEFDNLYLDMNGIIHPCFHPEDHEDHICPPTTFGEVFENIYEYIDCLFAIVRPQKLLFLAIDGVAPRAKMNQQRSRRFRTSKDNEIAEAEDRRLRRQFEIEGKPLIPKQESEISDSNIITPGTVFMHELSKSLQSYIDRRLLNNAAWKNMKVILSDANVPGEGEHKIMMFIRLQRASPGYNPNTRHCLYGLDADLIMLALATHEVHFSILREDVLVQLPIGSTHSKVEPSLYEQNHAARGNAHLVKKPYQFLHVWLLREYLELDMKIVDPPDNVAIDLERLIDDFIFICFFAGNDFLPHMPTLELHEGGMDLLMHVYKHEFKNLGGYLVDMQRVGEKKTTYVKLKRVEKFIQSVGTYEEKIFKKRTEIRERRLRRFLAECSNNIEEEQEEDCPEMELSPLASADGKDYASRCFESAKIENSQSLNASYLSDALQNARELKQKLKTSLRDRSDLFKNGSFPPEKVKLGTVGWKDRYYKEKFGAETREDMEQTRKEVVQKYTEGLCWVLLYYFSGVPSWNWFFPFHYGPFASDLMGLSQVNVNFQKGSQFKPFDQLMAVLPPRSGHALPRAYQALMNSEESDLIDFYPSDFEVDEEGKRFMWQAVCKLPFIVEERLLSCTKDLERELLDDEVERNSIKADILYVSNKQKLGSQIHSLYEKLREGKQTELFKQPIDTGLSGFISPLKEFLAYFAESNPGEDREECQENKILCAAYELPNGFQHIPRPLEGINFPEKTIREDDIVETQLWHELHRNMPSRIRPQNKYAIDRENPGSTRSYTGEIHKWSGSGWGCGRGVLEKKSSDAYVHTKSSYGGHGGKVTVSSSSPWGETRGQNLSRGSQVHNAYRGAYNSAEKWTSSAFGPSESRGIENLRMSDSRGFNCPGRAQPGMNTNFRTFRSSSESDWNFGWRQNVQAPAARPSQQGDRWPGHSGQHGEIRSRDSAVSTTNAWRHNQNPDSRGFNFRGRGQPGISSRNQYELLNSFENDGSFERRQTVQASEAASVQHRDSWSPNSAASTTNAWRNNLRGRSVPKANPTDWKLKGRTETSSSENLPNL